MNNESLATGYTRVDACDDASACRDCLVLLHSLPYFLTYKERSDELIALSAGLSILEVGCGIGDDTLPMAVRLAPRGVVVGVDASTCVIEEAVARCRIRLDAPHIAKPAEVAREMVRVLEPGGILLAYDNDWGTFCISGSDDDCTRTVETLWQDSFKPVDRQVFETILPGCGAGNVRAELAGDMKDNAPVLYEVQ